MTIFLAIAQKFLNEQIQRIRGRMPSGREKQLLDNLARDISAVQSENDRDIFIMIGEKLDASQIRSAELSRLFEQLYKKLMKMGCVNMENDTSPLHIFYYHIAEYCAERLVQNSELTRQKKSFLSFFQSDRISISDLYDDCFFIRAKSSLQSCVIALQSAQHPNEIVIDHINAFAAQLNTDYNDLAPKLTHAGFTKCIQPEWTKFFETIKSRFEQNAKLDF